MDEMIKTLKVEHCYASLALDRALRTPNSKSFEVALAYKIQIIDMLCAALAEVHHER